MKNHYNICKTYTKFEFKEWFRSLLTLCFKNQPVMNAKYRFF